MLEPRAGDAKRNRLVYDVDVFEDTGIVFAEAARYRRGWFACRGAQQEEFDAAVDREDRVSVVEADDRIDVAGREQARAQPGAPAVGRETRRQYETESATGLCQRDRALEKQLIPVRVAIGLIPVNARIARETSTARCRNMK